MRVRRFLGTLLLLSGLFLPGCANQASVLELEENTLRIRMTQRVIRQRLEALEKSLHIAPPLLKNQQNFTAELYDQIEALRTEVQNTAGRLSEAEHRMSLLEERLETESFQASKALEHLNRVSAQLDRIRDRLKITASKRKKPPQKPLSSRKKRSRKRRGKPSTPEEAYKLAYNDYVSGNYDFAISAFDAFITHYPESRRIPDALYWKGESYYAKKSYEKAAALFQQLVDAYPKSEKVPKAYFQAGLALVALKRPEAGSRYFQALLKEFPHSEEAPLARKRLAALSLKKPR